ncbi:hypothetical protein CEB3_c20820 [Peptococcaceae bacterium CEB3]|nr:hypothetical protein CEB3_c20820 [Peptococcaceae bacterium CEB3]
MGYRFNEQTTAFTDIVVWAPASGKSVRVYGIVLSTATNNTSTLTVKFGTGVSAKTLLKLRMGSDSSQVLLFPVPIQGLANQAVSWSSTPAAEVTLSLFGQEV